MLIGLTGNAGVGKDTVASTLHEHHGYAYFAIADSLKRLITRLAGSLLLPGAESATLAWAIEGHGSLEAAKRADPRVRQLLVEVGCGAREALGENVWVNPIVSELDKRWGGSVISDITFDNELDVLYSFGGQLVEVVREGCDEPRVPGNSLSAKPDLTLVNNGSLEDLRVSVREMLVALR